MRLLMRGRRLATLLVTLVVIAGAVLITLPYVHGLSFVIRTADMQGTARTLADLDTRPTSERELSMPLPTGPMRARLYMPARGHRRAVLLVSGLHPSGIDEPRLVRLAKQLSGNGLAVVTPDVPELSRFEISSAITDTIERAAVWLSSHADLAPDHRIGMMGISFSGGLSIIAAGRPSLADRVAYIFSFGGHDDVARTLRYLCTGAEPYPSGRLNLKPGTTPNQPFVQPPHDYGVAVILLGIADHVVPASQVEPLRAAVRRYLFASALDSNVDKPRAAAEFDALKRLAKTMPEPSATLLRYVNDRDVVHLGPRLLPFIGLYGDTPGLSVSKSPKPTAPVFLLHGTDDNVIPSLESEYLAEDLRGQAPVRLLLSGLISHAEADRPVHANDVLQLASFWGDILSR